MTRAYLARLQGSHDFAVEVDVMTMEERVVGRARFLDGQVNINDADPRRTASMTIADPAGALDFSSASAYSGTALWANRLVRARHVLEVPGYGEVTAVAFVGVPTAMSRNGGEVSVELADKSALAMTGAASYTVRKGGYAHSAIIAILRDCCGEAHFRVPAYARRLSRDYAVGLSDDASPWTICQQIAANELGLRLLYSNDGYVLLRAQPSTPIIDLGYVTQPADTSIDFTAAKNYASVTGGLVKKTVGRVTTASRAYSTATVPASSTISPEYLARNGVVRRLPVVVSEDAYTTTTQTAARARSELAKAAVSQDVKASAVPVFHLDVDDVVTVHADDRTQTLRFSSGSFPLGVGGGGEGSADMSIGAKVWVSRTAQPRVSSRLARGRSVKPLTKTQRKALAKKRRHHR